MDERDAKHRYWIDKWRETREDRWLLKLFNDIEDLMYSVIKEKIHITTDNFWEECVTECKCAIMRSIIHFNRDQFECPWNYYAAKCIRWGVLRCYQLRETRKRQIQYITLIDAPEWNEKIGEECGLLRLEESQDYVDMFRITLTDKQNDVLDRLLDGRDMRNIAEEMGVSHQAIDTTKRQIRTRWIKYKQGEQE